MSLLTSPSTTREQLRFFKKMEKEREKRGSFLAIEDKPHPLQAVNSNTLVGQEAINKNIQEFLEKIQATIASSRNSRIDYYAVLSSMRGYDFFTEVATLINEDLIARTHLLEKHLQRAREELRQARKNIEQKSQMRADPSTIQARFSGIKSLAQNLWLKAKVLNEEQWISLCDRVLLGQKVIIKRVEQGQTYKKWDQMVDQTSDQRQLLRRVDLFIESRRKYKLQGNDQQFLQILGRLRRWDQQKELQRKCGQPCCVLLRNPSTGNNDSQVRKSGLRSAKGERGKQRYVYKSDRSEQYFNRYYRKKDFSLEKVTSVERTNLEEMQKLEDDYRVYLKIRKKGSSSLSKT